MFLKRIPSKQTGRVFLSILPYAPVTFPTGFRFISAPTQFVPLRPSAKPA